jgi:alpha-tubulin suppressor-like RCC1 family protein
MKPRLKISAIILVVTCCALLLSARECSWGKKKDTKVKSSSATTFGINAPSNLSATVISTTQVNLSWTDNSLNEDGFEIERSETPGANYSVIAVVDRDVTTYIDNGPFSLYAYYRIRAFNTISDRSEPSNEVEIILPWSPFLFSTVSAGMYHNLAVSTDNTLWTWGSNEFGQLGMGDAELDNYEPFQAGTDSDWINVIATSRYSFAVKSNNTIWSWGWNYTGQLGLGDTIDRYSPTQIGTDSDWIANKIISDGNMSVCGFGIKSNNTLWAWGLNIWGYLGVSDTNSRYTPTQVGTDSDWSIILNANRYTIAQKTNVTLWAWGQNLYGQLGLGDMGLDLYRTTPTQINNDTDWSIISIYSATTTAIKTNPAGGTLWAWGSNTAGQLGLGDTNNRLTPTQVGTDSNWEFVLAENGATFAKKTNPAGGGTLWAWGSNGYETRWGVLGLGDSGEGTNRTIPTQIGTNSDWGSIFTTGYGATFAKKTNGTIWSWGYQNFYGELGVGDTLARLTPSQIGTDSDWAEAIIVKGNSHIVALKTNNTLWAWGRNSDGELGIGDTIDRLVPTLVRKRD